MVNPVGVMDLAYVVSVKKFKDVPLNLGDMVMVMSVKQVPAKASDPYLKRDLVVVAKVGGDFLPQIPKEGNDFKAYLIDPRSVEKVPDDVYKKFETIMSETYSG